MTIQNYKDKISEIGFIEFPFLSNSTKLSLGDFIEYDQTTLELKIYLAKLITCRSFPQLGHYRNDEDVKWFIKNFLRTYNIDRVNPFRIGAIKEAIEMVISDDFFIKVIIGTIYMFSIVEFYAKCKLGFNPAQYDPFDTDNLKPNPQKREYIKQHFDESERIPFDLSINSAIERLSKKDLPISKSINEIDELNKRRFAAYDTEDFRWQRAKIADRLSLARNVMLHGENHSFFFTGRYLAMIFVLFYLHDFESTPIH